MVNDCPQQAENDLDVAIPDVLGANVDHFNIVLRECVEDDVQVGDLNNLAEIFSPHLRVSANEHHSVRPANADVFARSDSSVAKATVWASARVTGDTNL